MSLHKITQNQEPQKGVWHLHLHQLGRKNNLHKWVKNLRCFFFFLFLCESACDWCSGVANAETWSAVLLQGANELLQLDTEQLIDSSSSRLPSDCVFACSRDSREKNSLTVLSPRVSLPLYVCLWKHFSSASGSCCKLESWKHLRDFGCQQTRLERFWDGSDSSSHFRLREMEPCLFSSQSNWTSEETPTSTSTVQAH